MQMDGNSHRFHVVFARWLRPRLSMCLRLVGCSGILCGIFDDPALVHSPG